MICAKVVTSFAVAAVHAQGMQFENFARQIFIDAEFALAAPPPRRARAASRASSESLPTEF